MSHIETSFSTLLFDSNSNIFDSIINLTHRMETKIWHDSNPWRANIIDSKQTAQNIWPNLITIIVGQTEWAIWLCLPLEKLQNRFYCQFSWFTITHRILGLKLTGGKRIIENDQQRQINPNKIFSSRFNPKLFASKIISLPQSRNDLMIIIRTKRTEWQTTSVAECEVKQAKQCKTSDFELVKQIINS